MKPIVAAANPAKVTLKADTEYYWCRCGRSKSQPFCDGSHRGTGFTPQAFTANEDGEVWLCRCKQTHDGPYCDGHHKQVPAEKIGKEFVLDANTSVARAFGLEPGASRIQMLWPKRRRKQRRAVMRHPRPCLRPKNPPWPLSTGWRAKA